MVSYFSNSLVSGVSIDFLYCFMRPINYEDSSAPLSFYVYSRSTWNSHPYLELPVYTVVKVNLCFANLEIGKKVIGGAN